MKMKIIALAKTTLFLLSVMVYGCTTTPETKTNQHILSNQSIAVVPSATSLAKVKWVIKISKEYYATPSDTQKLIDGAKYDVRVSKILYKTKTPKGEYINASGLVYRPVFPAGGEKSVGIACIMHGTQTNIEDAPSVAFPKGSDSLAAYSLALASQGIIVAVPDYIGYGATSNVQHPYEDVSVGRNCADIISASQELYKDSLSLANKTFLIGYSQGGNSCVATHKYIEENNISNISITSSMAGAGAINKIGFLKEIVAINEPSLFMPVYLWVLKVYKDVYGITGDYSEVFSETMNNIFKTIDYDFSFALNAYIQIDNSGNLNLTQKAYGNTQLVTELMNAVGQGKIDIGNLKAVLNPQFMLSESFRRGIEEDAANVKKWKDAFQANTIIDWAPKSPLLLFHGEADTFVSPTNTTIGYSTMKAKGGNVYKKTIPNLDHFTALPAYFATVVEGSQGVMGILEFVKNTQAAAPSLFAEYK